MIATENRSPLQFYCLPVTPPMALTALMARHGFAVYGVWACTVRHMYEVQRCEGLTRDEILRALGAIGHSAADMLTALCEAGLFAVGESGLISRPGTLDRLEASAARWAAKKAAKARGVGTAAVQAPTYTGTGATASSPAPTTTTGTTAAPALSDEDAMAVAMQEQSDWSAFEAVWHRIGPIDPSPGKLEYALKAWRGAVAEAGTASVLDNAQLFAQFITAHPKLSARYVQGWVSGGAWRCDSLEKLEAHFKVKKVGQLNYMNFNGGNGCGIPGAIHVNID
jgi:hypothetical protein